MIPTPTTASLIGEAPELGESAEARAYLDWVDEYVDWASDIEMGGVDS